MGEVPPITTGSAVIRAKHERVRFGSFEVDLRAGELRKGGVKIKLHGQPLDVLAMLLDEPGEMVTREELQQKLWAADTFVDFEHGLNKAINKLREALGDDADNPRFVETLPRRGYRFIVPVTGSIPSADQPAEEAPSAAPQTKVRPTYYRLVILGAVIVTVPVRDIAVSVSPASRTVTRPNSTSYTVTVSPINGFTGSVSLGVSGQPYRSTVVLATGPLPVPGSRTFTIRTTTSTTRGTVTLTVTATAGTLSRQATATLTVR